MKHVIVRPAEALTEYAERVAGEFCPDEPGVGSAIFYREDGEEALVVWTSDWTNIRIASVMLGRRAHYADVNDGEWKELEK